MDKIKYIISDLHLGHKKLMEAQLEPFNSIEEKHEEIIKNWNRKVLDTDVIAVLGDIGQKEDIKNIIPKLKGVKILILGNHDKYPKSFYEEYFDKVYDHPIFYSKRILLSHHPEVVEDGILNIHGHTHFIDLDKKNYINICIERINYTPQPIEKYVKLLSKFQKPSHKFLCEWYADIQISNQKRNEFILDKNNKILAKETREKLKKEKEIRRFQKENKEKD